MIKVIITLLLCSQAFATLMYHCKPLKDHEIVSDVYIKDKVLGSIRTLYIDVRDYSDETLLLKRAHYTHLYDHRIQTYGNGNNRVRIDRIQKNDEDHMSAFVRLTKFGIHSKDWVCKDI